MLPSSSLTVPDVQFSRVAFVQVMPDDKKQSATAFLKAAVAYYASLGVAVTRVMTDNGSYL